MDYKMENCVGPSAVVSQARPTIVHLQANQMGKSGDLDRNKYTHDPSRNSHLR